MDTTEAAMRAYAEIELLLFQNKDSIALEKLKYLKAEIGDHPLQDELMKLHADILLEKGEFRQSADLLTSLVENFPKDILSDDAYFLLGEIYERHLDDPEKASAVYLDFLSKYPGSVYAAEARKRFRTLRGDFENLEMQ